MSSSIPNDDLVVKNLKDKLVYGIREEFSNEYTRRTRGCRNKSINMGLGILLGVSLPVSFPLYFGVKYLLKPSDRDHVHISESLNRSIDEYVTSVSDQLNNEWSVSKKKEIVDNLTSDVIKGVDWNPGYAAMFSSNEVLYKNKAQQNLCKVLQKELVKDQWKHVLNLAIPVSCAVPLLWYSGYKLAQVVPDVWSAASLEAKFFMITGGFIAGVFLVAAFDRSGSSTSDPNWEYNDTYHDRRS